MIFCREKPIYITGITGAIGNAFAKRLLSEGVRVLAPFRTQHDFSDLGKRRADALNQLKKGSSANLTLLPQGQTFGPKDLRLGGSKVVFHLGGWSGYKIPNEDLPIAFAANVLWTGALVKTAANQGMKRFVFASTRSVYDFTPRENGAKLVVNEKTGISLPLEVRDWKDRALLAFEDYLGIFLRGKAPQTPEEFCREYLFINPLPGISPTLWYPLTKLMGEHFVSSLWDKGIEGISLRLKPVIGASPVEQDSRLIPRTVNRLLNNRTETSWPQMSGFLYLEDLVYALEALNPSNHGIAKLPKGTEVLLLGQTRQSISQYDLFAMAASYIGTGFDIRLDSLGMTRNDEIYDTSLADRLIGLRTTPFHYAIERTVRYFIDHRFLRYSIDLANKGAPDKLCKVGAVIVINGEIIGESFKDIQGRIHSDILSIASAIKKIAQTDARVNEEAKELLDLLDGSDGAGLFEGTLDARLIRKLILELSERLMKKYDLNMFQDATFYINLEPCTSGPYWMGCAEIIAKTGFKRVVTATKDPGLPIPGGGIDYLRDQGIEVVLMDDLASEAQAIDPEWFNGNKIKAYQRKPQSSR